MKRPTRILLTGAGGAAAIAFMKAMANENVMIFAADMDPYAAGLFLVPEERRLLIPAGAHPGFADHIFALCVELGIDVCVPTVDVELPILAAIQDRFEAASVSLMTASKESLERCLDKWTLFETCHETMPFPDTVRIDEKLNLAALPESLTPTASHAVILKPRAGSGGRGVQLIRSLAPLSGLPRDGSWLLQEFLPGTEYSVDVLSDTHGRPVAAVPRSRLKVDSGVAVTGRTHYDPELEHLARILVANIKLPYVCNVQLRRDRRGQARVIEINPRLPGTMSLTVAAGINMPALATRLATGLDVARNLHFKELAMVRTWQEHFVEVGALTRMEERAAGTTSAPRSTSTAA